MEQQQQRQQQRMRQISLAALLSEGVSAEQVWPFVLAFFFAGAVSTALGLTVAANDTLILVGMVLTGVAVVSMWLPGKGSVRPWTLTVTGAFLAGSVATSLSLTMAPSNGLLLAGMVLTSVGVVGMWVVGKQGRLAQGVCAMFVGGTGLQGVGLTLAPSDVLVMLGMILVSSGVFGMWFYSSRN